MLAQNGAVHVIVYPSPRLNTPAQRVSRPFKNKARTDGLELRHWVKTSSDPNAGTYKLSSYVHD
jgi:hypothetical protein